jgi:hypothetical protein
VAAFDVAFLASQPILKAVEKRYKLWKVVASLFRFADDTYFAKPWIQIAVINKTQILLQRYQCQVDPREVTAMGYD